MNYLTLLGCLCVGSGLSILYYRITNAIYFNFINIIILAVTIGVGVYFISKGRELKNNNPNT